MVSPALDGSIALALETFALGKQAIVFADSKKSAEKTAEDIARKTTTRSMELDTLALALLRSLPSSTTQCKRLAVCVKKGVAFHHAGLVAKQRALIENAFRAGIVKIICSTPTLALGVDLPAFRVIIKSLKRYTGSWGMDWIPVLEYHQMSGRAGRPKFHDDFGESVAVAKSRNEKEEIVERYVYGLPESIESKLAAEPVLRMYVLSLIATGFARSRKKLLHFFSQTFWSYQFRNKEKLHALIDKILGLLEQWEFLHSARDEFVSANELGDEKPLVATLIGKRVAELYIDPFTAYFLIKGLKRAAKLGVKPFSLLQLLCHTFEMRPLLRVRAKEQEMVQNALIEHYSDLLEMEPNVYDPLYDEFLDSIKTTLFLCEWSEENTEEQLLDKYAVRPGEIHAKLETADWLFYAMEELLPLLGLHPLLKDVKKLHLRVKNGVREELLPLLRLDGVGRVRARRLYKNGIKDIGDVKDVDVTVLARIIGQKTAQRIKVQLGQEVVGIPLSKRRGQINLGKFG